MKLAPVSLAFPNAYLETDEPPNHAFREKVLSVTGAAGLVTFGIVIASLHLLPTGYDPVTQAVSDYAVGPFGGVMAFGFFSGGAGLTALGMALVLPGSPSRVSRLGASLLVVAGLALFLVGVFPTDLEGAAATWRGTVHLVLSQAVFTFGPVGMLLVSYAHGWRWFIVTLGPYLATGAYLAANLGLSLGAAGLAERFFILVLLVWWIAVSFRTLRNPPSS